LPTAPAWLASRWTRVLAVGLILFAIALPFLFSGTSNFVNTEILALTYVMFALGLNIVVGFAGLLDLGYLAFFALGSYAQWDRRLEGEVGKAFLSLNAIKGVEMGLVFGAAARLLSRASRSRKSRSKSSMLAEKPFCINCLYRRAARASILAVRNTLSTASEKIVLPTRRLDPALVQLLRALKPGDKIKVTQAVRVGARTWAAEATGEFRGIAYLETGVTTERVKEDDLVVPVVRFTKPNGELTSSSIDENTRVGRA